MRRCTSTNSVARSSGGSTRRSTKKLWQIRKMNGKPNRLRSAGVDRCLIPTATERSQDRGIQQLSASAATSFFIRVIPVEVVLLQQVVQPAGSAQLDVGDEVMPLLLRHMIPSWTQWCATTCTPLFRVPLTTPSGESAKTRSPACWFACNEVTILPNRARQRSSRFRNRATIRVAWTSTATASYGQL